MIEVAGTAFARKIIDPEEGGAEASLVVWVIACGAFRAASMFFCACSSPEVSPLDWDADAPPSPWPQAASASAAAARRPTAPRRRPADNCEINFTIDHAFCGTS